MRIPHKLPWFIALSCLGWLTCQGDGAVPRYARPAAAAQSKTEGQPGIKQKVVRAFMHKKLASANLVLEGLATENFEQIAEGARQLGVTAAGAEFMVSQDPAYVEQANRFRRIVKKLGDEAQAGQLDGATLAYVDLAMRCVDCHRQVRGPAREPAPKQ